MASLCKRQQCTIDRRGFRQELDSWRRKLIHCVGFESILEGLFGPELVQDLQLFKDREPLVVSDWSFDENCVFCCLRRDKVKEHLSSINSEGLEDPPKPLLVKDQTLLIKLERQAEEFLSAVLRRKDVPNFSDPHVPVVAREILQRMIRQFAAEYTSKAGAQDSQPCSDQSLPSAQPLCSSPAPSPVSAAHSLNPVLSKLLMIDQDAPLDLTIKKPAAEPTEQDGVLDLSIKKNRSSLTPSRSSCLSPVTTILKGEPREVPISKVKEQAASTLERFMCKLCLHHQRQIVTAIRFLQAEVKALTPSKSPQPIISAHELQRTSYSPVRPHSVTPTKPKSEPPKSHSLSEIVRPTLSSCSKLKQSATPAPTLDNSRSSSAPVQSLVPPRTTPTPEAKNTGQGDHAPLKLKIMKTGSVSAGNKLSCVLTSSLSPQPADDRQGNNLSASSAETSSARLSSAFKKHESSHVHPARQFIIHADDRASKPVSLHATTLSSTRRTARKSIRPSYEYENNEYNDRVILDPDLGHCDIIYINKPITECFKKRHRGLVPRRNARKSTRGHKRYGDDVWEIKTVRTLVGRGNCPNPLLEFNTSVTPKQNLSKPEGLPPVDMPCAGECREAMDQQMATQEPTEGMSPEAEQAVETPASDAEAIVENSQTDQSQLVEVAVCPSPVMVAQNTEVCVEQEAPVESERSCKVQDIVAQVSIEAENTNDDTEQPVLIESVEGNSLEKTDQAELVEQSVIEKINKPEIVEYSAIDKPDEQESLKESVIEKTDEPELLKESVLEKTDEPESVKESVMEKTDEPASVQESVIEKTDEPESVQESVTEKTNKTELVEESVTEKTDRTELVEESVIEKTDRPELVKECAIEKTDVAVEGSVIEATNNLTSSDNLEAIEQSEIPSEVREVSVEQGVQNKIQNETESLKGTIGDADNLEEREKTRTELKPKEVKINKREKTKSNMNTSSECSKDMTELALSSKTLEELSKELPPWRKTRRTASFVPKQIEQKEEVVVGFVSGRAVLSSDRSLRRRPGQIVSPKEIPNKRSRKSQNKSEENSNVESTYLEKSVSVEHKVEPENAIPSPTVTPVTEQTSDKPASLEPKMSTSKPKVNRKKALGPRPPSTRHLRSSGQVPIESPLPPISAPPPATGSAVVNEPLNSESKLGISSIPVESTSLPTLSPTNDQVSSQTAEKSIASESKAGEQSSEQSMSHSHAKEESPVQSKPKLRSSKVVPEQSSSSAEPELKSSKAVPEPKSSKVVPEQISSSVEPEQKSSKVVPEPKSSSVVPEPKSSKAVPEPKSSKAVPEPKSSKAVPERKSSKAAPQQRSSSVEPELKSPKAVPEKSKTEKTESDQVLTPESPVKSEPQPQAMSLRSKRTLPNESEPSKSSAPQKPIEAAPESSSNADTSNLVNEKTSKSSAPQKPIEATPESSSNADTSNLVTEKPTRMPLRSEGSKTEPSPPAEDKRPSLRSQKQTPVANRLCELSSPIRMTKIHARPSQSNASTSRVITTSSKSEPPKHASVKFLEALNREDNQQLIANLNLKFDKMHKGWMQLDKEGQPTPKHRNKADRQAAIWKSKRRTRKPKTMDNPKYSPVQMLFMKGFDLRSISHWFLETTETKSLVIVKKVNTRLPSETQLCFHSSGAAGSSEGIYPSLQAERLKKHLKKFAIASPVKSNPKSQKLIAKALEQELVSVVKGKEKKEKEVALASVKKVSTSTKKESPKPKSAKAQNPASARILRKYSNIREKMQVQQANAKLKEKTKAKPSLKSLNKDESKSKLKPLKSTSQQGKKQEDTAPKPDKKKASVEKSNEGKSLKSPVKAKAVKPTASKQVAKEKVEKVKKEQAKRTSQRLGPPPPAPEPNVTVAPKKKPSEDPEPAVSAAPKSKVEKKVEEKKPADTAKPSKAKPAKALKESPEEAKSKSSDHSEKATSSKGPTSPEQVQTRSQRKSDATAAVTATPKSVSKKSGKSSKTAPSGDEPARTRSGSLKLTAKRSQTATLPRSASKKAQELIETPAKRTRTK